jgi:hypothetical protein
MYYISCKGLYNCFKSLFHHKISQIPDWCVCVCVCVRACMRERERERDDGVPSASIIFLFDRKWLILSTYCNL